MKTLAIILHRPTDDDPSIQSQKDTTPPYNGDWRIPVVPVVPLALLTIAIAPLMALDRGRCGANAENADMQCYMTSSEKLFKYFGRALQNIEGPCSVTYRTCRIGVFI